MALSEDDFLRSSTREMWTLKNTKRDELGFMIYIIANRGSLNLVLQMVSRLIEKIEGDWAVFSSQCAQFILADLQETEISITAESIAASISITDMHIAAPPKIPLQIEANVECKSLPRRSIVAAVNESGEVFGVQVSAERSID